MSEYVDFHYMPLEGKITGKQVLKQTEDAINDLGNKVYSLDIDEGRIDEAIEKSDEAINTADAALAAVTTDRAVWKNTVAEMQATNIDLGVTAATRGKMVFNDGSGAFYGVRSEKSGDVDSDDTVFLDNGNVAERIQSMNIIAKGNNIIFVTNVAELIDSDALIGNVYGTTGYYSANDGGAGVYTIRTKTQSDVEDGGSIIFLDNGNVAELIVDGVINVKQFGAKGDGVTDDADAIQKACDSKYDVIFGYRETYYINKKVTLKNNKTYDFNNSALVLDAPIYNEVTTALDSNNCIRHYKSTELFHDRTSDYIAGYTTKRLNGIDVTENLLGTYTFSTVEDYELSTLTIKNIGNIISNLPGTDFAIFIRFTQLTIDNANAQDVDNYNLFGISCCVDNIVKNCTMNIIAKNYSVLYPFIAICCNNTSFQNCNISSDVWHCLSVGGNQGVSLFTKYINCYLFGSEYDSIGEHENALFSIVYNCVINGAILATGATLQNTKILHSLRFFGMFNNSKNIVRDIIVDNCDINNDHAQMFLCYSSADIINKVIAQNSKLNRVDFDALLSGSFPVNWTVNDWLLNGCTVTGNVTIYNITGREIKNVYISNCKIDGDLLDGNYNTLETNKRVCMGCDVTGMLRFSGRIINCIANGIFGFYATNCVYTTYLSVSRINNNNITGAIS